MNAERASGGIADARFAIGRSDALKGSPDEVFYLRQAVRALLDVCEYIGEQQRLQSQAGEIARERTRRTRG